MIIGVVTLFVAASSPDATALRNEFEMMTAPMAFLLPVMAILLVTSEWSQRSALATFTMEPRRARVIEAKLIVAIAASIIAVVIAFVLAAVFTGIGGLIYSDPQAGSWSISGGALAAGVLNILLGVLVGFAFAALLLNTPAAIVTYFIIPMALGIVGELVPWTRDHLIDWIQAPSLPSDPVGADWGHLVVSTLIWFAVPMFFGVNRIMRSEIK